MLNYTYINRTGLFTCRLERGDSLREESNGSNTQDIEELKSSLVFVADKIKLYISSEG